MFVVPHSFCCICWPQLVSVCLRSRPYSSFCLPLPVNVFAVPCLPRSATGLRLACEVLGFLGLFQAAVEPRGGLWGATRRCYGAFEAFLVWPTAPPKPRPRNPKPIQTAAHQCLGVAWAPSQKAKSFPPKNPREIPDCCKRVPGICLGLLAVSFGPFKCY